MAGGMRFCQPLGFRKNIYATDMAHALCAVERIGIAGMTGTGLEVFIVGVDLVTGLAS